MNPSLHGLLTPDFVLNNLVHHASRALIFDGCSVRNARGWHGGEAQSLGEEWDPLGIVCTAFSGTIAGLKHNLASSVADFEGVLTPRDQLSHILRMLEVALLLEAIWAGVAIFLALFWCFHDIL